MGKVSSAKKVARAARAGGRVSSGQPRGLLFPGVLALIAVLGITLVVYARNDRNSQDLGGPPQLGDHIHVAYGINICGEFANPIPEFESDIGIHTHGDGVMHIHPFSSLGAGANATLGRFLKDAREGQPPVDVSISDTKLVFAGETFEEGEAECDGVDDPELRVAYWKDVADTEAAPVITTGGFADLRLTADGSGMTIFYGDPKAQIPLPPTAANLEALGAVDGTTTTAVGGAGEGSTPTTGATSTTLAGGSSTTVAESSTTPGG